MQFPDRPPNVSVCLPRGHIVTLSNGHAHRDTWRARTLRISHHSPTARRPPLPRAPSPPSRSTTVMSFPSSPVRSLPPGSDGSQHQQEQQQQQQQQVNRTSAEGGVTAAGAGAGAGPGGGRGGGNGSSLPSSPSRGLPAMYSAKQAPIPPPQQGIDEVCSEKWSRWEVACVR